MNMGPAIRKLLEEKNVRQIWLAEKLSTTRSNLNNTLKRDNVGTDVLYNIAVALDYNDFIMFMIDLSHYTDMNLNAKKKGRKKTNMVEEPGGVYTANIKTIEGCHQRLYMAEKEIEFLKWCAREIPRD